MDQCSDGNHLFSRCQRDFVTAVLRGAIESRSGAFAPTARRYEAGRNYRGPADVRVRESQRSRSRFLWPLDGIRRASQRCTPALKFAFECRQHCPSVVPSIRCDCSRSFFWWMASDARGFINWNVAWFTDSFNWVYDASDTVGGTDSRNPDCSSGSRAT